MGVNTPLSKQVSKILDKLWLVDGPQAICENREIDADAIIDVAYQNAYANAVALPNNADSIRKYVIKFAKNFDGLTNKMDALLMELEAKGEKFYLYQFRHLTSKSMY